MEPQDTQTRVTAAAAVKTINGVLPDNNHESPAPPAANGYRAPLFDVDVGLPPEWIEIARKHFSRRGLNLSAGIRSVLADYLIGLNLI